MLIHSRREIVVSVFVMHVSNGSSFRSDNTWSKLKRKKKVNKRIKKVIISYLFFLIITIKTIKAQTFGSNRLNKRACISIIVFSVLLSLLLPVFVIIIKLTSIVLNKKICIYIK